jgi:hypothetical protein
VPRLSGYQAFAPYLAIPFSNSVENLNLAPGSPSQAEYKVTLAVGDTVVVEVPGTVPSVNGTFQVDFLGFTTNPTNGFHPVLDTYPQLEQISNDAGLNKLIQNNMAAAFVAPMSGTYLIQITGPAQNNSANPPSRCSSAFCPATATACRRSWVPRPSRVVA